MYKGKLVNLLEASLIGYELIYVDKKKKLTKMYTCLLYTSDADYE